MSKELNEVLDLAPLGLEEYDEIEGYVIYSSPKVTDEIKELSKINPETKMIHKAIWRGLDSKTILIGFTKSPLKILWRDLKSWLAYVDIFGIFSNKINSSSIETMGFYSTINNKAVILLDPAVNIFGVKSRKIVPKITHELCHYAAHYNRKKFVSATMSKILLPFYKELFALSAPKSKDIPEKKLVKAIKDIADINERDISKVKQVVSKTYEVWYKYLRNAYSEYEAEYHAKLIIIPYVAFTLGKVEGGMHLVIESMEYYYNAYKNTFDIDAEVSSAVGQEFRLPSEVVAVVSEHNLDLKVAGMINKLPLKD